METQTMCDPATESTPDHDGTILRDEDYAGHTYTITRVERELTYQFRLYINGKLHVTDRDLTDEWGDGRSWTTILAEHAEKQINFLNQHL